MKKNIVTVGDLVQALLALDQSKKLFASYKDQTFGYSTVPIGGISETILLNSEGIYDTDPAYRYGKMIPYEKEDCVVISV